MNAVYKLNWNCQDYYIATHQIDDCILLTFIYEFRYPLEQQQIWQNWLSIEATWCNQKSKSITCSLCLVGHTVLCLCVKTIISEYLLHAGIYMKFRGCDPEPGEPDVEARISNILYENIYMDQPSQFAVWIGPAQQYIVDSDCSVLWPQLDNDYVKCIGARNSLYENIILRNITIADPLFRYIYCGICTGCPICTKT